MSRFDRIHLVSWAVYMSALAVLATAISLRAEQTKTESMNCKGGPVITRQYDQQPGDVVDSGHIEIVRAFTGAGTLKVSVCNAQLHVSSRPDARELKLTVQIDKLPAGREIADYFQDFRVTPDSGVIQLRFPRGLHASVTLVVPMHDSSKNEFNLSRGDLDFDAIGGAGSREINVGGGHMNLLTDGDKNYSKMEVNIGVGSLRDHRPGGHDGHFIVNRDYTGSGAGTMEINVGAGSLDIRQE